VQAPESSPAPVEPVSDQTVGSDTANVPQRPQNRL
jgi:hypothetical protein